MGRPVRMPGVVGALSRAVGVSELAKVLDTSRTSLGAWASGKTQFPALIADRLSDLMTKHDVKPMLYTNSADPSWYVASTVFGWITWRWNKPVSEGGGYSNRTRYKGSPDDLAPVDGSRLGLAKESGWPY